MNIDPRLDPNADPACRNADPELFFPLPGRNDIAEIAKAICNRCQVIEACRVWAVESKQAHGVLGGQTAKEREAVRREAAKADAEAKRRRLLGDLLRERAGDPDVLLKEFVHPPMPIAAWAE